ncbi:hypothetical protein AB0K80_29430 [Streptomyces sp. NPDC052682]|uniref:hypothetical protein n=1 Tax=Streptomyces sp. NPDC052682 TaxID=3154954 RepID=UPI003443816C
MTPWLCIPRSTGVVTGLCAAVLTCGLLVPYDAEAAPAASPTPSVSDTGPDRAGSLAGEGRQRPGRHEPPWLRDRGDRGDGGPRRAGDRHEDSPEGEDSAAGDDGVVAPETSPAPQRTAASSSEPLPQPVRRPAGQATEPVLRLLPLGSGLVLIGLGLALAFAALRLRRGLT